MRQEGESTALLPDRIIMLAYYASNLCSTVEALNAEASRPDLSLRELTDTAAIARALLIDRNLILDQWWHELHHGQGEAVTGAELCRRVRQFLTDNVYAMESWLERTR